MVHTGAYVSILTPGETAFKPATIPLATQERLPRTYSVLHVVCITKHTHDRRKSIGKKTKEKKDEEKERNEKKAKRKKHEKWKEKKKTRKARKEKTREETRKGKEKKRKSIPG